MPLSPFFRLSHKVIAFDYHRVTCAYKRFKALQNWPHAHTFLLSISYTIVYPIASQYRFKPTKNECILQPKPNPSHKKASASVVIAYSSQYILPICEENDKKMVRNRKFENGGLVGGTVARVHRFDRSFASLAAMASHFYFDFTKTYFTNRKYSKWFSLSNPYLHWCITVSVECLVAFYVV